MQSGVAALPLCYEVDSDSTEREGWKTRLISRETNIAITLIYL